MAKRSKVGIYWGRIGSTAFAAALGRVVGLLFAPQSGAKTRQQMSGKTKKAVNAVEKKARSTEKVALKALSKVKKSKV